ncbi:MAG TPA: phosphatidate cytidylyltransferase [Desulfobacteraceae bacterium]|nr:phosphatidate cytidylyltransferase [Desulfobacteraceae bacterium]
MGRVIPGLTMVALWVLLLFAASATLFWLGIMLLAVIALHEYFRMTGRQGDSRLPAAALITVALLPVGAAVLQRPAPVMAGLFLGLLGTIVVALVSHRRLDNVFDFISRAAFGVVYIGFCLAHLVLIRFLPQGVAWLFVLTAITAGGDTGAYYIGKAFGRRKLCPGISPNKTVAGALGGISSGVLAALLAGHFLLPQVSLAVIGLAALGLSVIGILGDLAESMIKRSEGIKDAGTILGGHGGVLDRIDSLLLTAPILFYLLSMGVLS